MTKPPAYLLYASDFLGGTALMTNDEVGIYIRLLCHAWNLGPLPADRAAQLVGCPIPPAVRAKFVECDGMLTNERLEKVRAKQAEYSALQSRKSKLAVKARQQNRNPAVDPGDNPGVDPGNNPGVDPAVDPDATIQTQIQNQTLSLYSYSGQIQKPRRKSDSELTLEIQIRNLSGYAFELARKIRPTDSNGVKLWARIGAAVDAGGISEHAMQDSIAAALAGMRQNRPGYFRRCLDNKLRETTGQTLAQCLAGIDPSSLLGATQLAPDAELLAARQKVVKTLLRENLTG
ncbi:MAG: DUF1376 domain-containing protein [Pirellulales bacterium]|nr:DUF1376 domain-containing protein [Pirellulales bacterium]